MHKKSGFPLFIGILLLSLSALLLEVDLTRVFSIGKWYHFAFMVVSIALLGYGFAGSFLTIFENIGKKKFYQTLTFFALFFFFSALASFFITNSVPFDPFRIMYSIEQWLNIAAHYLLLAIPFFSVGCVLALAFREFSAQSGRIYFFDLLGASLGSILFVLFALFFSPVKIVFLVCFLSLIAASFFSLDWNKRLSMLLIVFSIVFLSFALTQEFQINTSPYKQLSIALNFPEARVLSTSFNPISKIDIVDSPAVRIAPGLSMAFTQPFPKQYGLLEDNDGLNPITKFDEAGIEFLSRMPSFIPFELSAPKRVLLIGMDNLNLLSSFKSSTARITLVEENPLKISVVRDEFSDFSGRILENERTSIRTDSPRAFIESTTSEFDLIQLELSESIFASSTGLYGINESYQFTTEAFQGYYSKLNENGYLYLARWLSFPPKESLRIASTIRKALELEGVQEPEKNVFVFRTLTTVSFLVKKGNFSMEEIEKAKGFCKENGFDIVYYAGVSESEVNRFNKFPEPYYYKFIERIFSSKSEEFYSNYLFDVKAVSDDKPYFFNFFKWGKFNELFESMHRKWEPFFEGGFLVYTILLQALLLSTALIFLPVFFLKRIGKRLQGKKRMLSYFFFIGLGFMLFEIALIQKFILFLAQPTYSFSLIIASLLVSSGIGAMYSNRIKRLSRGNMPRLLLVLLAGLLFFTVLSMQIIKLFLGSPSLFKTILLISIVFPLGFLLGMPFPMGIRLARGIHPKIVTWGYALNGCASVIGAVAAIIVSINFGHSFVLALSALCYFLALLSIYSLFGKKVFR